MTTIITKNSSTAGAAPLAADLVQGELAVNVTSKALYTKNASAAVVKLNTPSIVDNGDATAITIDSSENVGIGTSSPSNKLSVVSPDNNAYTNVVSAYSNNLAQSTSLTFGGLRTVTGAGLGFYVNGSTTTAASIDTSGNLLVGGTSASFGALSSQGLTTTGYGVGSRTTGGGAALYGGWSGSTNVFVVFGNGNVANTNNSYGAISDIKLKENITDATPKLAQLNQVRVVNYNLIGDKHKQLGVIAQELEQIFPAMIEETVDRDEEGNDLGTTTKGVKYSVFVPMLVKAIQEQQALINAQQAALTTLTERITALEAK